MEKGTETREDAKHGVLPQVWNETCAKETRQGKNSLCVGLSKMRLQEQAARAEVGTHTEGDRARSTGDHRDHWKERTETASFAHNAH
jgi:hypothetical protein